QRMRSGESFIGSSGPACPSRALGVTNGDDPTRRLVVPRRLLEVRFRCWRLATVAMPPLVRRAREMGQLARLVVEQAREQAIYGASDEVHWSASFPAFDEGPSKTALELPEARRASAFGGRPRSRMCTASSGKSARSRSRVRTLMPSASAASAV